MSTRKKATKRQREARRIAHANTFNEGFTKGWELRNKLCTCKPEPSDILKVK